MKEEIDAEFVSDAEILARKFHNYYESLSSQFGYETRKDTRDFDKNSPNGQLMIEVCKNILSDEETFNQDVWAEKHGLLQFPKASKSERNEGCEELEKHEENLQGLDTRGRTLVREDGTKTLVERWKGTPSNNNHPTVKPVHLMAWLVRLVSKEGDTVLDPFMGSGTTGVACMKLNRKFIGIELNEEYVKIAEARLKPYLQQTKLEVKSGENAND